MPKQVIPGFSGQKQKEEMWCWAAVTSALLNCYRQQDPTVKVATQCELVSLALDPNDPQKCCKKLTTECQQKGMGVKDALVGTGMFNQTVDCSTTEPDLQAIQTEIANGRPVVATIVWGGAGVAPHMVVVGGVDVAEKQVAICDPAGSARLKWWDLEDAWKKYRTSSLSVSGTWVRYTLTRPPMQQFHLAAIKSGNAAELT